MKIYMNGRKIDASVFALRDLYKIIRRAYFAYREDGNRIASDQCLEYMTVIETKFELKGVEELL